MTINNATYSPETVFDQAIVVNRAVSRRAVGHTALEVLLPHEIGVLEGPDTRYRSDIVGSIIDFARGELDASDFEHKTEVMNLPEGFSRAIYIPKVLVPVKGLMDLPQFAPIGEKGFLPASAIDVFIPDSAHKGQAIRLIDLRDEADVHVDEDRLQHNNGAVQHSLDERFARDVQSLFNGGSVHRVLQARINTFYAQASGDKLRTYWRYVATDSSVNTEGYEVIRTIVRLADCASEGGEERLYQRLFGFKM